MRALRRWTDLDARDYAGLLHLSGDYVVTELAVQPGDWLADRDLNTLALRKEGVIVVGVDRPDGTDLGVPHGEAEIHPGDVLLIYARRETVVELDQRRRGAAGERAHRAAVRDQVRVAEAEAKAATARGTSDPSSRQATG